MKLLIAADSAFSAEVLVRAVGVRPWPDGTTAHVLSIVADVDVPEETWREEGYGKRAVQREMERIGTVSPRAGSAIATSQTVFPLSASIANTCPSFAPRNSLPSR